MEILSLITVLREILSLIKETEETIGYFYRWWNSNWEARVPCSPPPPPWLRLRLGLIKFAMCSTQSLTTLGVFPREKL